MSLLVEQIKNLVREQVVPNVSYAYLNQGQWIQGQYGVNTWQPQVSPLPAYPLYDLASLTKVLGTTTVLLNLIEQQKLTYDTPVKTILPEFSSEQVTLRHLMTHTSGIQGFIPHRDQLTAKQLMQAILQLPVTSDFNRIINYTDTGPLIVGWMVEKICQQPIQLVIQKLVLQPLKLPMATFTPNPRQCVVTNQRGFHWLRGEVHDPKAYQLKQHCGSAGLFAGIPDLIYFSRWLLGQVQPASAPVSQKILKQLFQSFTNVAPGRSFGWNLLWGQQKQPILYHTGYTGNFWLLDRWQQRALIVLSNRVHPINNNQRFLIRRRAIIDNFLNARSN